MKLSKQTLDILSSFYKINQGIVFNSGNTLSSVSVDKSVYAEANIDESIPTKFAVYDLGQLVSNITELGDPDLQISENRIHMTDGSGISVDYVCCLPELVVQPNNNRPPNFVSSCTFDLSWDTLSKLIKMASINQVKQFFITIEKGGKLFVGVCGNDSNNKIKINVPEFDTSESEGYTVKMDINNLRLMQGDYTVSVNAKRFAKFENKDRPITYVVAMLVDDR